MDAFIPFQIQIPEAIQGGRIYRTGGPNDPDYYDSDTGQIIYF